MENPYLQILLKLNEAGIRYLVVGGVAVNLLGRRRFTGDIDLVLALNSDNLERMTSLMHELDYVERLPVPLSSLADSQKVQTWIKEKGMTAYSFLSNSPSHVNIDILAAASLDFETYENRKVTVDLEGGMKIPVVALQDLIAMKREADRPIDRQDIEMLLDLLT